MRKLSILLYCTLLCACSRGTVGTMPIALDSSGTVSASRASHVANAFTFLYSFKNVPDGQNPYAGLLDMNGTLYGTTSYGGAHNLGAVFELTPGSEKVLYSFKGGSDGSIPWAGLIDVGGALYGTTSSGGGTSCYNGYSGCGTVFKLTSTGEETILFRFQGGSDGAFPLGGLVDVRGTLYGTTNGGGGGPCDGGYGCGTVFNLTGTGTETILHRFKSGSADGAFPIAGLIYDKDSFYGTTTGGGSNCDHGTGCGTVFKITQSGTESVLHRFAAASDGTTPYAGLTDIGGVLYGATAVGGTGGGGTIYKITRSGAESVVYSFKGGGDGGGPRAAPISVDGALYGTTQYGGTNNLGTIFKISPSGVESVLYSFTGASDGEIPYAGLINVSGALFGTAFRGGVGNGTVFGFSLLHQRLLR